MVYQRDTCIIGNLVGVEWKVIENYAIKQVTRDWEE
jgi:hypothetical protein